ncbi:MAG: hypothetical protein ACRDYF_01660 [Acidimicrobiia bacterium]
MTNPAPHSSTEHPATDIRPGSESTTGAPRWVKVFGIIILGLAVLIVGMKVAGVGPSHGPGRHGGGGGTPTTSVTEAGRHTPPVGQN